MLNAHYSEVRTHARDILLITQREVANYKRAFLERLQVIRLRSAKRVKACWKRGYDMGFKSGQKEGQVFLHKQLEQIKARQQEMLHYLEQKTLRLAADIAGEVIEKEPIQINEKTVSQVREVVSTLLNQQGLLVLVHPEEKEAFIKYYSTSNTGLPLIAVSDSIQKGVIIIEGVSGKIEFNWREHIQNIALYFRDE